MFDLTRTCDDKQCTHIQKAVEMADCSSADRGSSDSLLRSGNRIPSGITGSGIAVITVDPNSGLAVDAMMGAKHR
jgi:hypothetical protein